MADTIYDFTLKTIDGTTKSLADYKGRPVMIVNVASECGLTPQYEGLEKLHETYAAKGFAVLGFPANEFGAQEPGTDAEIQTFCTSKFGVKFDMFSKVVVKGAGIHPLFAFLTAAKGGEIKWNFNKFLIGKDGKILARWDSGTEPDDAKLTAAIEAAL
jgi:glutathione peroxidase